MSVWHYLLIANVLPVAATHCDANRNADIGNSLATRAALPDLGINIRPATKVEGVPSHIRNRVDDILALKVGVHT